MVFWLARVKPRGFQSRIHSLLGILARKSVFVDTKKPLRVFEEDPDGDVVLTTALEGGARYIVSGGKHLLRIRDFKGIEVVAVKRMLELLKDSKE